MKFKVGDKVRVRQDLVIEREYGGAVFTEKMAKFAGKMVTINGGFEIFYVHWHKIQEDEMNGNWSDEMFEKVEFTKADLKSGMVVEDRNGDRRIFFGDEDDRNSIFLGKTCSIYISAFTDTLEHSMETIDRIYISAAPSLDKYFNDKYLKLIWERPGKKMTVKEIEKELGYKIEIVADKEE
jgi:hypothetical protein